MVVKEIFEYIMDPNALGVPGEGVHKHVCGIAAFDLLGTMLVGYGIAKWMDWNAFFVIFILLIIGELAHLYFRVPTTVAKILDKSLR